MQKKKKKKKSGIKFLQNPTSNETGFKEIKLKIKNLV